MGMPGTYAAGIGRRRVSKHLRAESALNCNETSRAV
jgi:hypothetical protein